MKAQLTNCLFCLLLLTSWACSEKEAKQKTNELLLQPTYAQAQDIVSIADCTSPFGEYTTEVRSFANGSCYFLQQHSDSRFCVKLDSTNQGYLVDEKDEVIDTLSQEDVVMIRGHEFHKMSMMPSFFFNQISYKETIKQAAKEFDLYIGKDKLNYPVELLYDRSKQLITKIALINPKDTSQTIEILYDKWAASNYGDMAKEIRIIQAQKDTFPLTLNL